MARYAVVTEDELNALSRIAAEPTRVFVALKLHRNNTSRESDVSRGTLARRAGCSLSAVSRSLRQLEACGVVQTLMRTGQRHLYRFPLDGSALATDGKGAPCQKRQDSLATSENTPLATHDNQTTGSEQQGIQQAVASFDSFWKKHPKKYEKAKAREAFGVLVAQGVDPRELVRAAAVYANMCKRDSTEERFIMQGSRFLDPDARRWEEYAPGYRIPRVRCPECDGRGDVHNDTGGKWTPCPRCKGTGWAEEREPWDA